MNGAFGICRFTLKIRNSLGAIIAKNLCLKVSSTLATLSTWKKTFDIREDADNTLIVFITEARLSEKLTIVYFMVIRGVHISMGKFQSGFLKKHIIFPGCILLPESKYVRVEQFDTGK